MKDLFPVGDLGDVILWGDVETTGLDPFFAGDDLLQVAFFITDADLNFVDEEGYEAVVAHSNVPELMENTSEYVREMHNRTGLWERIVSDEAKTLDVIDREVADYITKYQPNPKSVWWGGNSIKLDRDFASVFLPEMYKTLGYRSVDVSSVGFLARNWYGFTYEKKMVHEAKEDILESIAELRAYRENIFR